MYCWEQNDNPHLLELLGVHVAVAVEVEHAEGDLELAPERKAR